MSTIFYWIKRFLPRRLLERIRPPYHQMLAYLGATLYRHPSKEPTLL